MAHPTIDRIRRARREIAAEHDYDPKKLGAYFRKLDREEEENERASALGELHTLIERLEEREERAEAEGMRELAGALFDDRARLAGAVERLTRQQGPEAAGTGA